MLIRKLHPWERGAVASHLLRLGPEDRSMRFCSPVKDAFIRAYSEKIDPIRTAIVGCFIGGVLRGAAELVAIPGKIPLAAEIGLSVEGTFQNRGIGGRLLEFSLTLARNRLIREIQLFYLPENTKLGHLLDRRSDIDCRASGEARLALPWPGPDSIFDEMASDGRALLRAFSPEWRNAPH